MSALCDCPERGPRVAAIRWQVLVATTWPSGRHPSTAHVHPVGRQWDSADIDLRDLEVVA